MDVKRAWMTAVLKAHGHKPTFTDIANLSRQSRVALDAVDLHFHDLGREPGSRWLERGVDLHTVRDWLGHTSIEQTSTYLAGTTKTQHDAMRLVDVRKDALQEVATRSKTGAKATRHRPEGGQKISTNAIGREATIM